MAVVSVSRRSASGIALIVAGALFVLAFLLPMVGVSFSWLLVIAYAAMAVALGILGFGAVNNTIAKVALIAAAIGWAILALSAVGLVLPGVLITIAALVAGIGGFIGAIVILVGKEIANTPALVFVIAMALGLLLLLPTVGVAVLGPFATWLGLLFGIALIIAGFLFRVPERRRR
jgi:hypothetical protein